MQISGRKLLVGGGPAFALAQTGGAPQKDWYDLSSNQAPKWTRSGKEISVEIPRVELHEVVAIDL